MKSLINRSFNIGQHIATIYGTNMNPRVPQYKNCWKWGHITFACWIHSTKCLKCNGLHKLDHHCDIAWCCKSNFKINPPRLKTPKDVYCTHNFKCVNYKEEYQADSILYPFWKHQFNPECTNKKSQKLQEIRANSICSAVNSSWKWLQKLWYSIYLRTTMVSYQINS